MYARATLYTTLSPCHLCSGAALHYKIPRLVLGENRTFQGAEDLLRSHGVEVVNLDSQECVDLMAELNRERPELWNEDIGDAVSPCPARWRGFGTDWRQRARAAT